MINIILYLIILLLGIPFGLFLAKICKDETKAWKRRLKVITIISIILTITVYLTNLEFKSPISIALLFIAITFGTISWRNNQLLKK